MYANQKYLIVFLVSHCHTKKYKIVNNREPGAD